MDITIRQILELIRRTLTPEQIERSIVYWEKRIHREGEQIKVGPQIFEMPFEGTIIFVDLAPRANWAHPCLYLVIDIKTLNAKIIEASFPPSIGQSEESYIIILLFGQKPSQERYFSSFDIDP